MADNITLEYSLLDKDNMQPQNPPNTKLTLEETLYSGHRKKRIKQSEKKGEILQNLPNPFFLSFSYLDEVYQSGIVSLALIRYIFCMCTSVSPRFLQNL